MVTTDLALYGNISLRFGNLRMSSKDAYLPTWFASGRLAVAAMLERRHHIAVQILTPVSETTRQRAQREMMYGLSEL